MIKISKIYRYRMIQCGTFFYVSEKTFKNNVLPHISFRNNKA